MRTGVILLLFSHWKQCLGGVYVGFYPFVDTYLFVLCQYNLIYDKVSCFVWVIVPFLSFFEPSVDISCHSCYHSVKRLNDCLIVMQKRGDHREENL